MMVSIWCRSPGVELEGRAIAFNRFTRSSVTSAADWPDPMTAILRGRVVAAVAARRRRASME